MTLNMTCCRSFLLLLFLQAASAAEVSTNIPFKPDPPITVDGALDDWRGMPGVLVLDRKEQATSAAAVWKSTADCSARVRLAWRGDGLYLAAEVSDDQFCPVAFDANISTGDHLLLYLDVAPGSDSARDAFGAGQFEFSFTPGTVAAVRGIRPAGRDTAPIRIASVQTTTGWNIEALVPWDVLGVKSSAAGLPLRFEVAVVDVDGAVTKQMTYSTLPWSDSRARLNAAVLTPADGKALPQSTPVFAKVSIDSGAKQNFKFATVKPPPGKEAVLVLNARLDTPKVGGYNPALHLALNGQVLDGARLVNKPLRAKAVSGRTHSMVAGDVFTTYYAPTFTAADTSSYAMEGVKTGLFELRVTDLLRDGENELIISNQASAARKVPLIATDGRIVNAEAGTLAGKPKAGPPTGALAVCVPNAIHKTEYQVKERPDARLEITLGGEQFTITSEFSTPDGKWARATNAHFRHTRRIERRDEAIIVFDTLENLTAGNLPIMQRHRATATAGMKRIWIGGLSPAALDGAASEIANPSISGITAQSGIGLLPLNDVFQVHASQQAKAGVLALSDLRFVLKPKASYTAEWAIVLTPRADYYDFVNATRRLLEANFPLTECFAFLRAGPETEKRSDEAITDFIHNKSASILCASVSYPGYLGTAAHGTSFQRIKLDSYQRWVARMNKLAPGVKTSIYFHCFLDEVEDSPKVFADARHLRADGTQLDYGKPMLKNFIPTESNSYGAVTARSVDLILDVIRADGVYWDEMDASSYAYHYGKEWDGFSADIDPRTNKITRLNSSATLISQSWRLALAKRIMARGPLIANGQPFTRSIAQLKIPRFVESGSISNCARAQLHSPIALGDHLTERSGEDAYRTMHAALDYGCLYHWYGDVNVIPEHPTLTQFMFPATPVELHEGYLIARERIITNRSGLYGWGDDSTHEVHVFNDQGREVQDFKAPQLNRSGQTLTELRIAEGWSAAIIKK